ncbi:MAG TPA: hypothetical protein VLW53_01865 [Candidatus Eisenbacteria bacterium]|nr:hypothetical protein [Candidatus Eisenbacteria bacterium]
MDPARLLVMGASRGGEAALLLGADFPDLIHAVAAYVPSSSANARGVEDSWPRLLKLLNDLIRP